MNPTIVPFIKWVGGKRQLLDKLMERMPSEYNTYYEPFIGGGALLFALQPKRAVINDLNKELIHTYRSVRNDPNRVREYLLLMELGHNVVSTYDGDKEKDVKTSPFYEKIRAIDLHKEFEGRHLNIMDSKYLRAARFIYLNKNTFNGLYRVNGSGHFNSPSKHVEFQKTFNWEELLKASQYLKTLQLKNIKNYNFKTATKNATKGDFIYFDPPYDYELGHKGFDSYQKNGFGKKGQKQLADWCKELDLKGVKWMVSNHDTEYIRELFDGFEIEVVMVQRNVGGKGSERKKVKEVLIKNYDSK